MKENKSNYNHKIIKMSLLSNNCKIEEDQLEELQFEFQDFQEKYVVRRKSNFLEPCLIELEYDHDQLLYSDDYDNLDTYLSNDNQISFSLETPSHEFATQPEKEIEKEKEKEKESESMDETKKVYLYRERQRRGEKSKLQLKIKGYWTNNFLPNSKNPHFDYLEKVKGLQYIQNNPRLVEIRKKNGITLGDYLYLYSIGELREVWKKFFNQKVLYRDLMISRADSTSKLIYVKLLKRFEQAFVTGEFSYIA